MSVTAATARLGIAASAQRNFPASSLMAMTAVRLNPANSGAATFPIDLAHLRSDFDKLAGSSPTDPLTQFPYPTLDIHVIPNL
jgi:hypothetical protein